jgi:hypothetical protein
VTGVLRFGNRFGAKAQPGVEEMFPVVRLFILSEE